MQSYEAVGVQPHRRPGLKKCSFFRHRYSVEEVVIACSVPMASCHRVRCELLGSRVCAYRKLPSTDCFMTSGSLRTISCPVSNVCFSSLPRLALFVSQRGAPRNRGEGFIEPIRRSWERLDKQPFYVYNDAQSSFETVAHHGRSAHSSAYRDFMHTTSHAPSEKHWFVGCSSILKARDGSARLAERGFSNEVREKVNEEAQEERREEMSTIQNLKNLFGWILFTVVGMGGMTFFLTSLYDLVSLLTEYPVPVKIFWEKVRDSDEVLSDMETNWFTYNWIWTGDIQENFARIRLQLYGITGTRGVAYGDLMRNQKTGEWQILVLNFYRTNAPSKDLKIPVVGACPHSGQQQISDDLRAAIQGHSTAPVDKEPPTGCPISFAK